MKQFLLAALLVTAGCGSPAPPVDEQAQPMAEKAWPQPDPADVSTLDGLMDAYYEVVSGPAGEARNWDRDKSLHLPDAQVVITRSGDDGETVIDRMTISDYHERNGSVARNAFYEYEINRVVEQHGSTVHVWSTYAHASRPDGEPEGRGVNSIEIVWDGSRYWITSWTYDGRRDAPPVPPEYLPTAP